MSAWTVTTWMHGWPLEWFHAFGFAGRNEMPCAWTLPEYLPGMRYARRR